LLVGARAGLTAVGDDDQSIYAWRGARPENLSQLQQDFPSLKLIKLEQNYRSTARILKAANALIDNNPHHFEKKLWSELGHGEPIRVITCENEEEEAERIATSLLQHHLLSKGNYRDYAVLYRGNHQSRLLEVKLQQHRIPYAVSGGTSFFARSEVKDIMAYLRLIANPDDDSAFLRIINTPRRAIGPATLEKLGHYSQQVSAQQQKPARSRSLYTAIADIALQQQLKGDALEKLQRFAHWLDRVRAQCHAQASLAPVREMVDDMNYEQWLVQNSSSRDAALKRMENVNFLLESLDGLLKEEANNPKSGDAQDRIGNAVARLVLQDMLEQQEEDQGNRVQLMTLHAAKGLEFPHVFLMGMEENLLPHRNSIASNTIEEERRLAYVGITRAQRTLTLTLAQERKHYGDMVKCTPSRFIAELPEEDLDREGGGRPATEEHKKKKASDTLASLKGLFSQS